MDSVDDMLTTIFGKKDEKSVVVEAGHHRICAVGEILLVPFICLSSATQPAGIAALCASKEMRRY